MRLPSSVLFISTAVFMSGLGATAVVSAPAEPEPAPPPGYQSNPQASGAVIGGILGQKIARRMDEGDRRMAADAEYQALEFGQPGSSTAWENPVTQHHGVASPAASRTAPGSRASRRFSELQLPSQVLQGKAVLAPVHRFLCRPLPPQSAFAYA